MLGAANDDYTPAGVTKSSRCSGCDSVSSEIYAYPCSNVSRILCLECIRGLVLTVTRELYRRRETTVVKA